MAGRERQFPGVPESVGQVREFVASCLPPACPPAVACDVALCVSEPASNAVLRSASGAPGGTFVVRVRVDDAHQAVGVDVVDQGPALAPLPRVAPGGYGLRLVQALAAAYEVVTTPRSRSVSCRLDFQQVEAAR
ncbi:ATP-binding protein [Thermopolyspora sp. NPDC052614]|uniref:ATP-binding protein n=1 Tax=Thermopolyspora sp. NPDC052614 TaxID=3155682 RepID=UPI003427D6B6